MNVLSSATVSKLAIFLTIGFLLSCSSPQPQARNDGGAPEPVTIDEFPDLTAPLPTVPMFEGDLFIVYAHADDELISLSYVFEFHRLHADRAVHWIMVSDSGKGWVSPLACGFTRASKCRAVEAQKVSECLGIAHPMSMHLPDGALAKVEHLDDKILRAIKRRTTQKVGAVMTLDELGIYGHPDHLAVHDSVKRLARQEGWPLITSAIPKRFREKLKVRFPVAGRSESPVTHVIDMNDEAKKNIVCAIKAHRSQSLILWLMRQMTSAEEFTDKYPRQFFSVSQF